MTTTRGFSITVKGTRLQAEKAAEARGVAFTYYREEGKGDDCRTTGLVSFKDKSPLFRWFFDVPLRGVYPIGSILQYHVVNVS